MNKTLLVLLLLPSLLFCFEKIHSHLSNLEQKSNGPTSSRLNQTMKLYRQAYIADSSDNTSRIQVWVTIKSGSDVRQLKSLGFDIRGKLTKGNRTRVGLRIHPADLKQLESLNLVDYITPVFRSTPCASTALSATQTNISGHTVGADTFYDNGIKGKGVLIGIYDTGIDWEHKDLRNPDGSTRIVALWDQTIDTLKDGEHRPSSANFGVEYTHTEIDTELIGYHPGRVRSNDFTYHGTHIAGIAAGNGLAVNDKSPAGGYKGMAPEADLIIVKGGFSDADVVAALDYMDSIAAKLNKPLAVSFSFGNHFPSHDGTNEIETKIDQIFGVGKPGRFIAVAAGNDGHNKLHTRHAFPAGSAPANTWDMDFSVPSYTANTGELNDVLAFSFWFQGSGHLNVRVFGPDASGNPTVDFGSFNYNRIARLAIRDTLLDSVGLVQVSNTTDAERSLDNIVVYVADKDLSGRIINPQSGTWRLRFTRTQTTGTGQLDGWYCNKPENWVMFTIHADIAEANSDYTLVVPATCQSATIVGGFISANRWRNILGDSLNYYSKNLPYYPEMDTLPDVGSVFPHTSLGPTRDERQKPDILAPAEAVMSAWSTHGYTDNNLRGWDSLHQVNSGTSMASPHVAGMAALLFCLNPLLNQREIDSVLKAHAIQDAYMNHPLPSTKCGFGKLHLDYSMVTDIATSSGVKVSSDSLYGTVYPNPFNPGMVLTFYSPRTGLHKIEIFDIQGRSIFSQSLIFCNSGTNRFIWNGVDKNNKRVATGLYVLKLGVLGLAREWKILLTK